MTRPSLIPKLKNRHGKYSHLCSFFPINSSPTCCLIDVFSAVINQCILHKGNELCSDGLKCENNLPALAAVDQQVSSQKSRTKMSFNYAHVCNDQQFKTLISKRDTKSSKQKPGGGKVAMLVPLGGIFRVELFQTMLPFYTHFQWTEDGQGFQIQYLTLDT